MMFIKSILIIAAMVASAKAFGRRIAKEYSPQDDVSSPLRHWTDSASAVLLTANSFKSFAACDKEDVADCTEFCGASKATGTCTVDDSGKKTKVTCSCKGGGSDPEGCSNCLICLDPGMAFFSKASPASFFGGSKTDEEKEEV